MSLETPCVPSKVMSGTTGMSKPEQESGLIEVFSALVCQCGRGFRLATRVEHQVMEDLPSLRAIIADLDSALLTTWEAHKEIRESRS